MEINSFQIFQHPTTHHVYSLLLIKISGNLNTSQLENIFPNSKPYLPVRVSIQAGIPDHTKECLLVPKSTAQVLFCWAFLHFRRFFLLTCVRSVFQNTFDIQYKDTIQMSVIISSSDNWNLSLTGEPLIGRGYLLLAEIGPKQDNLVTRLLEIHRQDRVEPKYRVTVLKTIQASGWWR